MSPTSPTTCTHDRGRGTTVCLRCRHDQWQAAQRRRQQMLMRVIALAFVVGIIGVAGVGMAGTLRDRETPDQAGTGTARATDKPAKPSDGARPPERPTAAAAPTVAVPAPTAAPSAARPRLGSLLAQGRTSLTDSIHAFRSGDSVIVSFDTQGGRTRRADKFERVVRSTLPLVYGRLVTSSLDSVPEGSLLPSRDVVGALSEQGMHLVLENGLKISIRPLTRVGRDGPLVVAYWTVVER
jgi:hypothetical protein